MKYLYWLINLRNSITELRQNYKYFLTNILKLIKSFLCTQHHDRCFGHYNTISEVVYWVLKYINKRLWSLTMKCLFLSYGYCVVVVPLLSSGWLFETPWTAAQQAPLSSTISWSLLKFMSIESVMLFNHLTSATRFSFCLQSFSASGSFLISQLFESGASATASVFPLNVQGWFPLGLTGLISLLSRGLSRVFISTTVWKHQFFDA